MAEGGASKLKAVIIGGTGATGKNIIGYLLKHKDKVENVTVLGRRKFEFSEELSKRYGTSAAVEEESGRLVQHVEDLATVSDDTLKSLCSGSNAFFSCIGASASISSREYFRIECEIPDRVARMAAASGVRHAGLLTSQGSNSTSWLSMLRTKAEVEERFKKAGFGSVSVFRPGWLERGADSRFSEKVAKIFFKAMKVEDLAKAMVQDAFTKVLDKTESQSEATQSATFEVEDIKKIFGSSEL